MEIIYERIAAIDVGKKEIAVAIRTPADRPGERRHQLRKYATFYNVLREMVAWLVAEGVTHVAMEATGCYWRPVFHALCEAEQLEILLVNARHVQERAGPQDRPVDRTTGPVLRAVRAGSGLGWLGSLPVINDGDVPAGVVRAGGAAGRGRLRRPAICSCRIGWLTATVWWLSRSAAFFAELAACGRPATTQRSYGMDLLRWFRFLWAVGVELGSGDPGRGAGFLPVAAGRGQADAAALAVSGRRRSGIGRGSRPRRGRTR